MDRMAQSRHSERTANLFPRGGRPLLIIEIYQPTFSVEPQKTAQVQNPVFRHRCSLVLEVEYNVFEKALLALVLLSYIQAFTDGNKRTARISTNAILIAWGYCPILFRTEDSVDYKKAMLMFYEQNNIAAVKHIFIEQYEFAVEITFNASLTFCEIIVRYGENLM